MHCKLLYHKIKITVALMCPNSELDSDTTANMLGFGATKPDQSAEHVAINTSSLHITNYRIISDMAQRIETAHVAE